MKTPTKQLFVAGDWNQGLTSAGQVIQLQSHIPKPDSY